MALNDKEKYFMELYETFLKGNIQMDELEIFASLNNELETCYKKKEDWLRMHFLINLKLSERKLSSSDIDGCRNGLQDCHKLLVERKAILNNSIDHLYANEASEKTWKSDSCKLDLLALEVLILDENFDTAQIVMSKCEAFGMTQREESHLAKLAYLAGSRLFKMENFECSTIWLKTSFSIGRRINNNEVTHVAGKLLLKLMTEQKDWRQARALIDLLPHSYDNQLYLLRYQIEEGKHIQVNNMIRNLVEKTPVNCVQAYQLLGVVSGRDDLIELINEFSIGENWNKKEQEEWLTSLACLSLNESTAYRALSNYIQWVNKNIDQSLHYCLVVMKFADKKLEELYNSQDLVKLEKWLNALIFLAQVGKVEELFSHFAECLVACLLKQNNPNKAIELLEKWQLVFPKNAKLIHLRVWLILQQGNIDAFPILIKALQEKCLKASEDFWLIFTVLVSDCIESQRLSNENIQILFSLLADCDYFGSLDLLKFGVLIFCRMKDAKTVISLLSTPSVKYLISEDYDTFCSRMCWNLGLKITDHSIRYQLLRLSNQLLPPKDPAFFSTRLASISAGLSCLSSRCIAGPQAFRQLSTDIVQLLETQSESKIRRAALLYQFRLSLLTEGRLEMFRSILRKLEELKDVVALETLSLMAAEKSNFIMDDIAVDAILKAVSLNCKFKEGLLLTGLEIISRGKGQSGQLSSIIELLSIIWKEKPNSRLIVRAIRIVWNAWVKDMHQGETCSNFGAAVVVLYNLISKDKILSVLEKPTLPLCYRIRNIIN